MRRNLLDRLGVRRLLLAGLISVSGIPTLGIQAVSESSAAIWPLAIEDAVSGPSFHLGGRPALSSDGRWVAYTVCDPERLKAKPEDKEGLFATKGAAPWSMGCDVWMSPTEGSSARNLTQGQGNNWGPSWSPDGRLLAFYSDRIGHPQLFAWETRTGRSRPLASARTRTTAAYENTVWSPDSRHVVVKLHPEGMTDEQLDDSLGVVASGAAEEKERGSTVVVYRSAPAPDPRKEEGALLRLSNQAMADLSVIDVATGRMRRLAPRIRVFGFWISPDGSRLAYLEQKGRRQAASVQRLHDLVILELESGSRRVATTGIEQAYETAASWSPDGKWLAYLSGQEYGGTSEKGDCFVIARAGGEPRKLEGAKDALRASYLPPLWDRTSKLLYLVGDDRIWRGEVSTGRLTAITPGLGEKVEILRDLDGSRIWSPDSTSLYMSYRDKRTNQGVFSKVDLSSDEVATLLQEEKSYGYTFDAPLIAPDGRLIVYLAQSARESQDLWVAGPDFRQPRRLTSINPRLAGYTFGASRLIEFTNHDGQALKAALLLPAGYEEGKRYPTVVFVYPQDWGSETVFRFGLTGFSAFNLQMLATRGYAVLQPDVPVGKGTIMQDLVKSVMPAIDAAVRLGVADPDRLAVTGQSAGGYSTLALVAQTNRFKAAIMNAGFGDLTAFYGAMVPGDGSGGWVPWLEVQTGGMGAPPWEVPQSYIQNSPIYSLHRIQTPMLIQAGAADSSIVPYSDQVFAGLKRAGKDATYLRYGGEGHLLTGHANLVDYWKRAMAFLDERLRSDAGKGSNEPVQKAQKRSG